MIELLRETLLFSNLNSSMLMTITETCTTHTYPAGTILFHENEVGTVFYLIVYGSVKIFTSNRNGDDKILSILTKGDSFGELSLLDGMPRSATAQAIEETKLISLTHKGFNKLLKQNFDMTSNILKQLSARLRETNQQVHDLTYLDAKQRVMKCLVRLAKTHGRRSGAGIHIKINLDFEEVSNLASVEKTQLFEVFSELQSKGILSVSGSEFLLNLWKLQVR